MKKYVLSYKDKVKQLWIKYDTYKDSRTPITIGRRIIKEQKWILKVRVTEIEENTIYEEEGE